MRLACRGLLERGSVPASVLGGGFAAGMIAGIGFGVSLAMTAAGVVVLLPSIWMSYRLDLGYRGELRAAG